MHDSHTQTQVRANRLTLIFYPDTFRAKHLTESCSVESNLFGEESFAPTCPHRGFVTL
jgi:hypothetical protein